MSLSREQWHELLQATLERAVHYRASLAETPVAAAEGPRQLVERLTAEPLARTGRDPARVVEELARLAGPGLTGMAHPRFFGWVTGGTLPAALAADWLCSAWDQNAGSPSGAPAAYAFEVAALGWVKELLGLPAEATGALVTGATMANFVGLAAARSHVLASAGWDVERRGLFDAPRVRILVGHERHPTIDKALALLGFGQQARVALATDAAGRLAPEAVSHELARSPGPTIICAQVGNVNSGAFDPLLALAKLVAAHREQHGPGLSWLHVDGAFGIWAKASSRTAHLVEGLELADSWATDGHKILNLPYDCGVALTRHGAALRRAMAVHGPYLSSGQDEMFEAAGAFAPELSRRARGFVLWAGLRQLGASGVAGLVERLCDLARLLASELGKSPGLIVDNTVVFNQVVVRFAAPSGQSPREFVQRLVLAIQAAGVCYPTPTIWRGNPAIRFSVANADTSARDIELTAQSVRETYRQVHEDLMRSHE